MSAHGDRRVLLLVFAAVGCVGCESKVPTAGDPQAGAHAQAAPGSFAVTERDAQVKRIGEVVLLSPELFEKMAEQEAVLQERGIPGYRPIYVKNYYRFAYVDPETNKLAYRGMTCTHPDCNGQGHDGGPFVFPHVVEGLSVGDDGKIIGSAGASTPRCPACNRTYGVERYTPPEVIQRRSELQAQIAEIRRARDEARASGQPLPELTTTPREIMQEISNLAVLYLVEE